MGKHHHHLRVISADASACPGLSVRAPDPHLPPPPTPAMRRIMFGDFASLLLLSSPEAGVRKAAELDRELLACCAEAHAAEWKAGIAMDGVDAIDDDDPTILSLLDAAHPLFVAYSDAIERAAQLPARTPEGLRAKGTLLLLHISTEQDHTTLAASLARDVTGRVG